MIIERCAELEKKLKEYEKYKALENVAQLLGNCQGLLKDAKESISFIIQQAILFQENGLLEYDDFPETTKALEKLNIVHQKFKKTALNITKGKDFNFLIKFLNQFHEVLSNKIKSLWHDWFDEQTRFIIDEKMLGHFKEIPNYKGTIDQINLYIRELLENRDNIPSTQDHFDYIKNLIKKIRRLIDSIPLEDLPDDVKKFLKALNTQTGASLDYLTETVLKWLKDYNLTSSYYIKPSIRKTYSA